MVARGCTKKNNRHHFLQKMASEDTFWLTTEPWFDLMVGLSWAKTSPRMTHFALMGVSRAPTCRPWREKRVQRRHPGPRHAHERAKCVSWAQKAGSRARNYVSALILALRDDSCGREPSFRELKTWLIFLFLGRFPWQIFSLHSRLRLGPLMAHCMWPLTGASCVEWRENSATEI